jgi:hypothetical protein
MRDMRPEYMFSIGRQIRLARWVARDGSRRARGAELAATSVDDKVTRILREASELYRRRLPVAAAILIGVASEAAWVEVAEAAVRKVPDLELTRILTAERSRATLLAVRTDKLLKTRLKPIRLELLNEGAHIRDVRNHAAHGPAERFDEKLFGLAKVGLLLEAAVDYFRRPYALIA